MQKHIRLRGVGYMLTPVANGITVQIQLDSTGKKS